MTADRLTSRVWIGIGVVAAVMLLLGTWFLAVGPTRSDAADLRDQTAGVQTQNTVLTGQLSTLKREADNRTELAAQVKTALGGLPPGTSLPVLSRQVAAHAAARGVVLTGFSIGSATAPGAGAGTPATTAATAQVLAIPVTLTSTGSALAQLFFLRDLQQVGPRLALITSVSLAPGQGATGGGSVTDGSLETASLLTVQMTVFTHRLSAQTREHLAGLLDDAPAG